MAAAAAAVFQLLPQPSLTEEHRVCLAPPAWDGLAAETIHLQALGLLLEYLQPSCDGD